eukprot:768244-Prymnesium_polylepis.1
MPPGGVLCKVRRTFGTCTTAKQPVMRAPAGPRTLWIGALTPGKRWPTRKPNGRGTKMLHRLLSMTGTGDKMSSVGVRNSTGIAWLNTGGKRSSPVSAVLSVSIAFISGDAPSEMENTLLPMPPGVQASTRAP